MTVQTAPGLPNALVVGPMKAGTSWIHDYLQSRGDVALPHGVKETFFFDRRYDKGEDWYAQHFRRYDADVHRLCIEVAPSYFHCPEAPARIKETLGEIPLIVTLRDPVKRAWSHYLHLQRYGYTSAPLQQAAVDFPQILMASRYRECISRWQAYFSIGQIHVVWQEKLAGSVEAYSKQLCETLSLPYAAPSEELYGRSNAAAMPRSLRLAAAGDSFAHFLRRHRLYGVVNFAKQIGLKEFFFGRPGGSNLPVLKDADAQWLERQLSDDIGLDPATLLSI